MKPELPISHKGGHEALKTEVARRRFTARHLARGVFAVASLLLLLQIFGTSPRKIVQKLNLGQWCQSPNGLDYQISEKEFLLENCVQDAEWSSPQSYYDPSGSISIPNEFTSYATLDTPFSYNISEIHFVSRGCQSGGSFSIITSPEQPRDRVTFNISRTLELTLGNIRSQARVCTALRPGHPRQGLGIFSPECDRASTVSGGRFHTIMIIPEPDIGSQPTVIKNLRAEMVNTNISIGAVSSKVFFDYVSLTGKENSAINIESLSGSSIFIHTAGAPIRGTFNSTTTLELTTSNAPITVDVNLNNTRARGMGSASLTATTSNSPIQANVSLFGLNTTFMGASSSRFSVNAHTSNSPVDVQFKTAPVGSALTLGVVTTNSPAMVIAHPTYQGPFTLSTTVGEVELEVIPGVVDPSGKGRPRQFEYTTIKPGYQSGRVYWGPDTGSQYPTSRITIETSNSPVILTL